jgi:hypothetical protein
MDLTSLDRFAGAAHGLVARPTAGWLGWTRDGLAAPFGGDIYIYIIVVIPISIFFVT